MYTNVLEDMVAQKAQSHGAMLMTIRHPLFYSTYTLIALKVQYMNLKENNGDSLRTSYGKYCSLHQDST